MHLAPSNHKLTFLCTGALILSLFPAGCAPVDGEEVEGGEEESELAVTEQALSGLTPVAFTMASAYNGTSLFSPMCSAFAKRDLVGHEPSIAGKFPVAVWLTGTGADFKGEGAAEFTRAMASLGFVAASVEYDNAIYPTCSLLKTKASCVFKASSSSSAISKLCARSKADCSKGVVVAGISQGANLASLAKNYDNRARAAYLLSNIVTPSIMNNTSCLQDSATAFAKNQVRSVSGASDEYMGSVTKVRSNLVTASGYNCSGNNCIQADGSGWYIVSDAEVSDRKADHCYLLNNGCNSKVGDPTYATGTAPWTGWTNVKWLASRISQ